MHILRALGDALFRPSMHQNWPRDRKLTQTCWCLGWFLGLQDDVCKILLQVHTQLVVTQVYIAKMFNKNIEIVSHLCQWAFQQLDPIYFYSGRSYSSDRYLVYRKNHSLPLQWMRSCLPLRMGNNSEIVSTIDRVITPLSFTSVRELTYVISWQWPSVDRTTYHRVKVLIMIFMHRRNCSSVPHPEIDSIRMPAFKQYDKAHE